MPLAQFFTGYRATQVSNGRGLVTGLRIPKRAGAGHFIKLGARSHLVISIVMVAGTLEADAAGRVVAARLAVGACSAVAQRLTGLERELAGQRLDDQLGCRIEARHLALLTPIDDIRADADYRRAAALAATRDLVRDLARAAKRGPS